MLQTMSDAHISQQTSRTTPCLDALHHRCTVPVVFIHKSPLVLSDSLTRRVIQIWHVKASAVVHLGVIVKKWKKLKQVWHLINRNTERSRHLKLQSEFGRSVLTFPFRRIDSPAIRMQADELFGDFSAALHYIDGCLSSPCHNQCQIWWAIVWNSALEMWLINASLDMSCQYVLKGRCKL